MEVKEHVVMAITGMHISNAYKYCEASGLRSRLENINGHGLMVTGDNDPNRVNLTTVDGVVTKVRWG
jgi:hypothetical protein